MIRLSIEGKLKEIQEDRSLKEIAERYYYQHFSQDKVDKSMQDVVPEYGNYL